MPKKHIVHIIPTLNFGGAERMVVDLVNNLDEKEFNSTIITFFNELPLAKELNLQKTSIKIVPKHGKFSLGLFSALKKALRDIKPDVVHTHLFSPDVWGRIVAHGLGVPVITTEHNLNISESCLKHWLKRLTADYTNVYAVPSRSVGQYLLDHYKTHRPIERIRYGIDLDRFRNVSPLEGKPEIFQLVTIGRLVEQKGHTLALRALAGLTEYAWEYTIIGDGSLLEDLKVETKKLQIENRVHFLPATHNIPQALQQSHIFLMPSVWEGLGIVAVEAMAAGRIVIASAVDGLDELVEDKKTGLKFEKNNIQDLQKNILFCFNNFSIVRNFGFQAKKQADQEFGVGSMVKKYEQIYRGLFV